MFTKIFNKKNSISKKHLNRLLYKNDFLKAGPTPITFTEAESNLVILVVLITILMIFWFTIVEYIK